MEGASWKFECTMPVKMQGYFMLHPIDVRAMMHELHPAESANGEYG